MFICEILLKISKRTKSFPSKLSQATFKNGQVYCLELISREGSTEIPAETNAYGIGEELLFPITLNDVKSETNSATYLVKSKGFERKHGENKKECRQGWSFK